MNILKCHVQDEFTVKGSRFLSELFPCSSQNEARTIIKEQKNKYKDSTHVVHAFVIGMNKEVLGLSDDGEPSGTAGRPVLDVLKGQNCTNVLLTVTRWFGGTLLGTGGLVKAYGDGAKGVIQKALEENYFEEFVEKEDITFSVDYSLYQKIKQLLPQWSVSDLDEQFGEEINLSGKVPSSKLSEMAQTLKDLSGGRIIL